MDEALIKILYMFSNQLLITKNINIKSDISDFINTNTKCIHFITNGKYKNTICNRKIYKNSMCKTHSKYINKSQDKNIYDIDEKNMTELTSIIYKNSIIFINDKNVVYEKYPNIQLN